MQDEVAALVVLKPASGREITGASQITSETLQEFAPDPGDVEHVARALAGQGLEVGPAVGISMSVSGPRDSFETAFGVKVAAADEGGWVAEGGQRELPVPRSLADKVHAVTFEPPAETTGLA